jgi:hypothetical protein
MEELEGIAEDLRLVADGVIEDNERQEALVYEHMVACAPLSGGSGRRQQK